MDRRFFVRTHKLAAEKFVSELLCLHKSTIFCHAYFVRGELNPFYEREKWKVCRARNSLSCSITITQFEPLLEMRNIYQTLVWSGHVWSGLVWSRQHDVATTHTKANTLLT